MQGRYQRLQLVENGLAMWKEHGVKKFAYWLLGISSHAILKTLRRRE